MIYKIVFLRIKTKNRRMLSHLNASINSNLINCAVSVQPKQLSTLELVLIYPGTGKGPSDLIKTDIRA